MIPHHAVAAVVASLLMASAALAEAPLQVSYPDDSAMTCDQLRAEAARMIEITQSAANGVSQTTAAEGPSPAQQERIQTAEARRAVVTGLYEGKNCSASAPMETAAR